MAKKKKNTKKSLLTKWQCQHDDYRPDVRLRLLDALCDAHDAFDEACLVFGCSAEKTAAYDELRKVRIAYKDTFLNEAPSRDIASAWMLSLFNKQQNAPAHVKAAAAKEDHCDSE